MLSFGFRQTMTLQQRLTLTLQQRHELRLNLFALRMELMEDLYGERYSPEAVCTCGKKLDALEILKGFTNDPLDLTTECPTCKRRFRATLSNYALSGIAQLPFYCKIQTMYVLERYCDCAPELLLRNEPAIYHSALVHFGNLKNAFKEMGMVYAHAICETWEEKVSPFLGRMRDITIAECVGVSKYKIRKLRLQLGIERYTHADAVED